MFDIIKGKRKIIIKISSIEDFSSPDAEELSQILTENITDETKDISFIFTDCSHIHVSFVDAVIKCRKKNNNIHFTLKGAPPEFNSLVRLTRIWTLIEVQDYYEEYE